MGPSIPSNRRSPKVCSLPNTDESNSKAKLRSTYSFHTLLVKLIQRTWWTQYSAGEYGFAWVGSDTEPTQTIYRWYIASLWTLDYSIGTCNQWDDTNNQIQIEVIYLVYDATGTELQRKTAWIDVLTANDQWQYHSGQITRAIEKGFSVNLQANHAYTFRVMLKVTINNQGYLYQCHADSNQNNPACLTVSRIEVYDDSP